MSMRSRREQDWVEEEGFKRLDPLFYFYEQGVKSLLAKHRRDKEEKKYDNRR